MYFVISLCCFCLEYVFVYVFAQWMLVLGLNPPAGRGPSVWGLHVLSGYSRYECECVRPAKKRKKMDGWFCLVFVCI